MTRIWRKRINKRLGICLCLTRRGHAPADREAADGRREHVCTYSVVPTLGGDMSPDYKGFHGNDKWGSLYTNHQLKCATHILIAIP